LGKCGVWGKTIRDIIPVNELDHGRNKLTLARDVRGALGMCPEHSSDVLAVAECRQEMQVNMKIYAALKTIRVPESVTQVHLRAQADGKAGLHFFSKVFSKNFFRLARTIMQSVHEVAGIGLRTYRGYEHLEGEEYTTHDESGLVYRIPHPGFFQTNYTQAGKLLSLVIEYAEPKRSEHICDIYSGCGFYSIRLATLAKSVTGIDSSALSHDAAIENAKLNGIANVRFVNSDAVRALRSSRQGAFDTVVIDPPRMGCDETVIDGLVRIRPKKIVYVSCAPLTLLRDSIKFARAGYRITKCQPVDMFPHTYHIETVVQLVSKE
jgi:tRNA/tmRNA/rRNA uracil-C5-methylase (TrmA/RlmC/RlmD family)